MNADLLKAFIVSVSVTHMSTAKGESGKCIIMKAYMHDF
jgi:hypothetical protein